MSWRTKQFVTKNRLWSSLLRIGTAVSLAVILGTLVATYVWLDTLQVFDLKDEQLATIVDFKAQDNTLIFARNGEKIGELFSKYHVHVPIKQMPKGMVDAVLAIEDRSYWQHRGFDPRGILRAATVRLKGGSSHQGASTITQQVVRNFLLTNERSLQRKIQEIGLAIQLEKRLSKERILEIYLNTMFLGNGAYGVGAAAHRYFGKELANLDVQEFALIAGLFQSPSRYNPARYPERAKKRQLQVLSAMVQARVITQRDMNQLGRARLVYKEYRPINEEFAPYFIDFVREETQKLLPKRSNINGQGLRIYTTLDIDLQRLAERGLASSGKLLDDASKKVGVVTNKDGSPTKARLEAALLSVDPTTGEILAMVGGRNYAESKFNRTTQALRSPGSAFKPVVYAQALAQGYKWSDVIFVSPITIDSYRPRTPEEDFGKETTLLRAFYRSMNTPTVEIGQKIGLAPVTELAKNLGIRSPLKDEFGTMLGSSDVTMMDLSRMYSTFANYGNLVEHIAISKITSRDGKVLYAAPKPAARSKTALTPQIAFLMTEGMRTVLQFGTGASAGHLANFGVGKTGTSNESTDNWFCGYGSNIATVVWVGTDEHVRISGNVTGGKLALPIWEKFMSGAFKARPPAYMSPPEHVVTAIVNPHFGTRTDSGVRMYFVKGNEPPAESASAALEALSATSAAGYRDVFRN
mgnify:CR=1 FL=1